MKSKKLLALIAIFAMILSMGSITYADELETPADEPVDEPMLIGTYTLDSCTCRDVYYEYLTFSGNYSDFTSALADTLAATGNYTWSVAVSIASSLGSIYSSYVMDACYSGWTSGNGATLYVYDNTTPLIIAN